MSGWILVPVTPTEEMHAAAVRTLARCTGNDDFPPRVWRAMLAAAPQAVRDCPTCVHNDKAGTQSPCKTCIHVFDAEHGGVRDEWTPIGV